MCPRQCSEVVSLLEENLRLIFQKISEGYALITPWLLNLVSVANSASSRILSDEPQRQEVGQSSLRQYVSHVLRALSLSLTTVKALAALPEKSRQSVLEQQLEVTNVECSVDPSLQGNHISYAARVCLGMNECYIYSLALLARGSSLEKPAARLLLAFLFPSVSRVWSLGTSPQRCPDSQEEYSKDGWKRLVAQMAALKLMVGEMSADSLSAQLAVKAFTSGPSWCLFESAGEALMQIAARNPNVLYPSPDVLPFILSSSSSLAALMDDLVCSALPEVTARATARRLYNWGQASLFLQSYKKDFGSLTILLHDHGGDALAISPPGALGRRYKQWINSGTSTQH